MPEHIPKPPFHATSGPTKPKILLVGEAWGESEEQIGRPFAGESGKELFRILGNAMPDLAPELHAEICAQHRYGLSWVPVRERWLAEAGIAMTNVLAFRPPRNKLEALCSSKAEVGAGYIYPPITKGKYLRPEFLGELERLREEVWAYQPNLILALGNTACWALLRATNIGSIRGAVAPTGLVGCGFKCLPTYHPAGVLRNWSWRPIVVADCMKAFREAEFSEIRRPRRRVLVNPTIEEIEAWTDETLAALPPLLAPDIETKCGQIKCIGFARSIDNAMVIPFLDESKPGWNYWPEHWLEARAWDCARRLLESQIPKLFQNGMYDAQYIMKDGTKITEMSEDTMLLHHSIYPEMQKGLGFLGSIYTGESSWKLMSRDRPDSEKRDE